MDIKHLGTDLSGLNQVKIFDAKGKLIKVVQAKRIEFDQSGLTQIAKKRKAEARKAKKRLRASD